MTKFTKEQYICARDLIRNYKNNSDFKECGTEYMDEAERNSYELALETIYQYGRQIASYKKQQKNQRTK